MYFLVISIILINRIFYYYWIGNVRFKAFQKICYHPPNTIYTYIDILRECV